MRFRFSIRDLLWLTLVIGLIVGWWLDRRQQAERYAVLEKSASVVQLRALQHDFDLARSIVTGLRKEISKDEDALKQLTESKK